MHASYHHRPSNIGSGKGCSPLNTTIDAGLNAQKGIESLTFVSSHRHLSCSRVRLGEDDRADTGVDRVNPISLYDVVSLRRLDDEQP